MLYHVIVFCGKINKCAGYFFLKSTCDVFFFKCANKRDKKVEQWLDGLHIIIFCKFFFFYSADSKRWSNPFYSLFKKVQRMNNDEEVLMRCDICCDYQEDFTRCAICNNVVCDLCVAAKSIPYYDLVECSHYDIGCWRCYYCRQWCEGVTGTKYNPICLD